MPSVWFIGRSDRRTISSASWSDAGVSDAGGTFTWSTSNGYSYPTTVFSPQQLAWLDAQNSEFWVGAPDGPRTVVIADPVGFVTEARVRELIAATEFNGLTKASVGLSHVDDTADVDKPVSTLQALALAGKADYPGGGTDGQVLVKAGTTTAWAVPAETGGNSGATAVTAQTDTDWDSGTVYLITGSGVAPVADADWDSGTTYTIS